MDIQGNTPAVSEQLFHLLVSRISDYAIFMLNPQGFIISWNTGAGLLKGYSEREIIGRHFSCFYPPEAVADGKVARMLETAKNEGRVEDEGWRVRKDGSRFWADVIITALCDDAGQLLGFAKITRDLTERRRAEEGLKHRTEELERTTELLHERVYELEHFYDVVVGRELKMISLEKEVQELRERLALNTDIGLTPSNSRRAEGQGRQP